MRVFARDTCSTQDNDRRAESRCGTSFDNVGEVVRPELETDPAVKLEVEFIAIVFRQSILQSAVQARA